MANYNLVGVITKTQCERAISAPDAQTAQKFYNVALKGAEETLKGIVSLNKEVLKSGTNYDKRSAANNVTSNMAKQLVSYMNEVRVKLNGKFGLHLKQTLVY